MLVALVAPALARAGQPALGLRTPAISPDGDTVGMPVPGTCTAVWWERLQEPSLVFGIPQVGLKDRSGDLLERKHLDPDHTVDNDPALEARGRDQQLETAVEVLLGEIEAN